MPVLETKELTKRFGDKVAVRGLSLTVEEEEIFGLLGPNGAGKTTAIKMLTTLLPPSGGSASVGGYDVRRQAAEVRRVIGYVPQLLSADGALTGFENLLVFGEVFTRMRAIPRIDGGRRRQRLSDRSRRARARRGDRASYRDRRAPLPAGGRLIKGEGARRSQRSARSAKDPIPRRR